MGLSAVNPKVWAVVVALFVLAMLFRHARARWVRHRRRLAERLAAAIRARQRRQGTKRP